MVDLIYTGCHITAEGSYVRVTSNSAHSSLPGSCVAPIQSIGGIS